MGGMRGNLQRRLGKGQTSKGTPQEDTLGRKGIRNPRL